MNDLEIQPTGDQSPTLFSSRYAEIYHSRHGALTESQHVFIRYGLKDAIQRKSGLLQVGEMGLGTFLNAALAFQFAENQQVSLSYKAIEAFPPDSALLHQFSALLPADIRDFHEQLIIRSPGQKHEVTDRFSFRWEMGSWPDCTVFQHQDVFFYDAFSPDKQPELWTPDVFRAAYEAMADDGILVTYCSKGYVRRNMLEAGFRVERLPGPPGKREMLRAFRSVG